MDVDVFLTELTESPDYARQITHVEVLPARPARMGTLARPLDPPVAHAVAAEGINELYIHQVAAIEAARAGRNVCVVTGTASGKTLCYNVPVLERLAADPDARALYLFPTKALAQDQLGTLERLVGRDPLLTGRVRPATYDGDTPRHLRSAIKRSANLILSNPDMLHQGILPYHARWGPLFLNLAVVVVDEIHTYRGIFGSNVALVLRRLQRLCEHYGARPQFICSSATIANPKAHAEALTNVPMEMVTEDGAPRGRRHFVLWNPPVTDQAQMIRKSANIEGQRLMTQLVERDVQTIVFTKARVVAELIYRYAHDDLERRHSPAADRIRAYRGGYLAEERRAIEKDLFSGRLLGVSATNALELGIDVGSLEAAIIVGFPGTIASTWQQAGRAGRASDDSLSVLIAYDDPVDQFIVRHPEYFFAQSPEHAVVDAHNPYVLANHLQCAAFELPLSAEDVRYFGPLTTEIADVLAQQGLLRAITTRPSAVSPTPDARRPTPRWYWSSTLFPAAKTNLRTISENTYAITDVTSGKPQSIGMVDSISAPELVYPEAVYLHEGETYVVRALDVEQKIATVERQEVDYYTQAVLSSSVRAGTERARKPYPAVSHQPSASSLQPPATGTLHYGDASVTWQTVAFRKVKFYTMESLGQTKVDLPSQTLSTTAFWFLPPAGALADLERAGYKPAEGLAGLRNLLMASLPILAMCDRRDVSGVLDRSNFGRPALFLYDRYPGGLGFAETGYNLFDDLLGICRRMVNECPCDTGCPSCVGLANLRPPIHADPDLGFGYAIPDKAATTFLLDHLAAPDL
jgi:DEAD/DEAH box helicase domain-containing protein